MDSVMDELNPPDLISSVPVDSNPTAEENRSAGDQPPSVNIMDADLLYKINNLHCPFIWKPEDSLSSFNRDSVEDIMDVDEVFDEASVFKLRKFVMHLILCYNNFGKRLLDKSLKNINEMERMLLNSMKNRSQDVYFTQINDALFHILHSCRVVMLHSTNQTEKALEVLNKITPYSDLNPRNQAGVWAVRANLYVEFGYDGIKAAIQYIERATSIDDDNPYWHFTRGMYLGRLRRMESNLAIPSVDEISSLELAMKLKEDASFMAFAAEVYVETANRSKKKSQELLLFANENERRKLAEKNNLINERAAMLLKKSVQMNENCAHLLFRCGKGMLKLAPPYQDIRLAREYLSKGLEISYESSFGNHAMAMYYLKHENNYEMAKKYLIKATESKNFGADIDLIRVNFLVKRDPGELLNCLLKLFDRYNDKMKHRKILAEIVSYYLFIEYNLTEVIKYFNKLLYLIGDHDDIISVFKSSVLRQKFPVSLLEILLSDIADRSNKGTLNADEQEECRRFMQRLVFQNVNLPRPKKENLRKKFIKDIKENFKEIKMSKINHSPPSATEKPSRKDYNPVESRFEKEYAKKYYAQEEPSKNEKTVVDEFFEKYEAAAAIEKEKPCSVDEPKSKDSNKFHPVIQQLFSKMKETIKNDDSTNDLSECDEEIMNHLAKRLDLHLSISAHSENKYTVITKDGASTSRQNDHFDDPDVYRRRSSRSPRKRSRSGDKQRTDKKSSHRRSDSRDSYHSTGESYKKRPSSTESRYSTRNSRQRRSVSRESRKNRSPSEGSRISSRTELKSSRRRSKSNEDRKSSSKRSLSRESRYSVKSNRRRSTSRDSRSPSRDGKLRRKKRSTSRESTRSSQNITREKRSVSRESHRSSKVELSRRERSDSKESHLSSKEFHRKRSVSRDSRRSSKPEYHRRSVSKESRKPSKERKSKHPQRVRSISKESHRSNKEPRRRSTSNESCQKTSRRSRTRSPRPEREHRSRKSKKYESDDTLTGYSSSDTDHKRSKPRKSHRDDRYRRDDRDRLKKGYSSDETRSIHSRRSSSKESHRSKRTSSKDRRKDGRRKYHDKKYRKYSSSEDSSTSSSSGSSYEEVDRLPKSSRRRKSSIDEDFGMRDFSKNDYEKSGNQKTCSASIGKQKDSVQDNGSIPENGP